MSRRILPKEPVLVWANEDAEYLTAYEPGKRLSTHLGVVILPDPAYYGMVVPSHQGTTFYLLPPTTADLAMRVRRKTNIIYPKEAGLMILETGIQAGSRVLEVGTGSGALTIVLARIVGDEGKVYSFDRRRDLQENAIRNVKRAGLAHRVEFRLLDPTVEGFGVEELDAAFVDVPEPWTLVRPVWEALKPGGSWASLSPNIEQVQMTVRELDGFFVRIRTVEVILRPMLIREGKTRPRERIIAHTGYLTFAQKVLYYQS